MSREECYFTASELQLAGLFGRRIDFIHAFVARQHAVVGLSVLGTRHDRVSDEKIETGSDGWIVCQRMETKDAASVIPSALGVGGKMFQPLKRRLGACRVRDRKGSEAH